MISINRVIAESMGDNPPEGWPRKLSVAKYAALDTDRKNYYSALYAKYRTKKIRDYDFEDGSFIGWKPIKVGIGDPIGYKYHGYIAAKVIDAALKSNVLTSRILGNKKKWD